MEATDTSGFCVCVLFCGCFYLNAVVVARLGLVIALEKGWRRLEKTEERREARGGGRVSRGSCVACERKAIKQHLLSTVT